MTLDSIVKGVFTGLTALSLSCSAPARVDLVDKATVREITYNKQFNPSDLRTYFESEQVSHDDKIFKAYEVRFYEINGNLRPGVYYSSIKLFDLDNDKKTGRNTR